jgi:hypothetical protein
MDKTGLFGASIEINADPLLETEVKPTPFHDELNQDAPGGQADEKPSAQIDEPPPPGQPAKEAPPKIQEKPAPAEAAPPLEKPAPANEPRTEKPVPDPRTEPRPAPAQWVEAAGPGLIAEAQRQQPTFFNPKFKNWDEAEVEKLARRVVFYPHEFKSANEAHIELMMRTDFLLSHEDKAQSKAAIPLLLNALKEGKEYTEVDGKPVLSDVPLTTERRIQYHQAIITDLETMHKQARRRMEHAIFCHQNAQFKDSEESGLAAKKWADDLPIDLIQKEAAQLSEDSRKIADPALREQMQKVSMALSGSKDSVDTLPIQTRKFLTMLYLGTDFGMEGDQRVAVFGKNSGFKPDKALENAKETREKTKEILKFDPLDPKQARQDPEIASLFGGLTEIFGNPEKYNLYKLVDKHQVENLTKELKNHTGADSMLADVGVVALTAGILALSRSPKVQAGLEKMLSIAPGWEKAAPKLAKLGGLSLATAAAPLARHYGYEALTGTKETWVDTGVHVGSSLAAAELGSRLLGKGSMFTGKQGNGLNRFSQFDREGSANWLSMHGYDTTGKLSGLLSSRGYEIESKLLAKLPPGTKLTSEAGLKAIEAAQLTNARMGTVANAVAGDLKASSGIDSSKLADALASKTSAESLATVDDIAKALAKEQELVDHFLSIASKNKPGASVYEALNNAGFPHEGMLLDEPLRRIGVETVGQAQELAKRLKHGMKWEYPRIAELQAKGLPGTTKLTDLANMINRVFDGPGLERLVSKLPADKKTKVFYDKLAEEFSTGSGGKTKIQQQLLESGPVRYNGESFYGVPTPNAVSRSRYTSGLIASGAVIGTYNSTAKTWDLAHSDNPQTGQQYSWSGAFKEAHLPTVLDDSNPEWLRSTTSILAGTPGQIAVGAILMKPGAMFNSSPWPAPYSWADRTPFSHRAWNNWNATFLSKPGLTGAGALGAGLWEPILEDHHRNGEQNKRYKELLKNNSRPIENNPALNR